jgi:NADH-quinone oxidoreductase subunit C
MNATELLEYVGNKLTEKFHGDIDRMEVQNDIAVITVNKDKIHEVMTFLKNDPEINFHFLTDLTGIQTPDEKHLGVVYHLHNMQKNFRIRIKAFFPITNPEIASITDLYAGANWMERETYDFFGVKFKGHPNLKRILNMDQMDYHPLRKEYPLEDQTREDKNDAMFGR